MERRRNGINKGFTNDYERLYKAGISNHQYEYRISYKLQADAVVGLFERRSGPPVLHVMSYEGKGITKKWFDFCDYMSSAFRDVILSSNN